MGELYPAHDPALNRVGTESFRSRMNWKHLRKMLGAETTEEDTAPRSPFQQEIVPGELKIAVHLHSVEKAGRSMPCWSYVTEGLARHKQREAIFTVVQQSGEKAESYSLDPMEFFRGLLSFAKQGRTVEAGGFTWLAGGGLLGFHGFTYMEPVWRPPGVSPHGDWLAVIGLAGDEVSILKEFGSTRVLSVLGQAERFYPAPYWNERNRPSRVSAAPMSESLLAKVARINSPGFSVFREGNQIVLRARADRAAEAVKALSALAPEAPLALLTRTDPSADGALVWLPGQAQANAITPRGSDGKRICGSFMLFLPEQEEDLEQVLEDGFALHLTSRSWGQLRGAILAQEDIETPLFALRWIPAVFDQYLPSLGGARPPQAGRIRDKQIVLLQPDAETSAAITASALAGFAKSVAERVHAQFSRHTAKGHLRVTIKFQPDRKASYELATQGAIDKASLQQLWDAMEKLATPTVEKPVGFAVDFEIGD